MDGNEVAEVQTIERPEGVRLDRPIPARFRARPALPVVPGLRPKQVLAAMKLVEGHKAKDVAASLSVSPETVSRWRTQPAFQILMRDLLQDSIDAIKLGMVSLCSESIMNLRCLIGSFDDKTALKAIGLVLTKVGPVLTAINIEGQRPVERNSGN